jgi:F0F1-type ATP synthase membrane subunit b/b'
VFLAPLALAPADSTGGVDGVLLQYGPLGAFALVLLYFAWNAIKRERQNTDTERARANRLEEQLRILNETVQSQTMRALNEATKAVGDALRAVESIRSRREPK